MSDDRQQVRRERTRRSLRPETVAEAAPGSTGGAFVKTQNDLGQLDDIISTIVTLSQGQPTVAMGEDQPHGVDAERLSNEERVRQFRQQGGQ